MKSLFTGIDSCSHTAVSSAQVIYSVMSFLSVNLLLWRGSKKKIRASQECPKVAFFGTRLGTQSFRLSVLFSY